MIAHVRLLVFLCALVALGGITPDAAFAAPQVWTGPDITFSKPGAGTPELPENQDRLTDNVWITRGGASSGGIFNIAPGKETSYVAHVSPIGTKWATELSSPGKTITATNHAALTFIDWAPSFGGPGPDLIGYITSIPAVVKLVGDPMSADDDIFMNLQFTEFDSSGLFTYERSTFVAQPATPTGDYDGSGIVDAYDYTLWRNNLGDATEADINFSGDGQNGVDAADYGIWKLHYGDSVPPPGGGGLAVPEPGSIGLLIVALFFVNLRRAGR